MEPAEYSGALAGSHSVPSTASRTRATAEAQGKESHCYRPLPKEFRRDGFDYREIARESNTAIYSQAWSGCSDPVICFELVRVRQRAGFWIHGRFVEPAEVYPNSEAWGVDGWTFSD